MKLSVSSTGFISEYEIIYVDSNSTDESVNIAKKNGAEVIEIDSGYTTAALGRYLGKKYAKYENLLFLDSDMYLTENWFVDSKEYFDRYGAIIGERYEKLYKDDKVIKEIPKFYGIKSSEVGGFLMIKKELVEDINYTSLIRDEEEKDFYAKFYDRTKIYRVPVTAYIHNNYNLTASRIKGYLNPYAKNGYILSMIKSIKDGYFRNYLSLQKKYLLCMVVSVVFYLLLVCGYMWAFVVLELLLLNGVKSFKGSLMTTLFFPYKFLTTLIFLNKKQKTKYIYHKKEYEMDIKL